MTNSLNDDGRFLLSTHKTMREVTRQAFIANNSDLLPAYYYAINVIASQAKKSDGQYRALSEKAKQRGPIIAALVNGLSIVEDSIFEGYPTQASALVRQEYEALTALTEIELDQRIKKITPKASRLKNINPQIYNRLSEVAHFSNAIRIRELIAYESPPGLSDSSKEDTEAWGISPRYSSHLRTLFGIHIYLILLLTEYKSTQIKDLLNLSETKEEAENTQKSIDILIAAEIVTLKQ